MNFRSLEISLSNLIFDPSSVVELSIERVMPSGAKRRRNAKKKKDKQTATAAISHGLFQFLFISC